MYHHPRGLHISNSRAEGNRANVYRLVEQMRVRGYVVLDSRTWGRLCAILMGVIATTIVLIAINKISLSRTSRQGTKNGPHVCDRVTKYLHAQCLTSHVHGY